jgi:hypothetical protein
VAVALTCDLEKGTGSSRQRQPYAVADVSGSRQAAELWRQCPRHSP